MLISIRLLDNSTILYSNAILAKAFSFQNSAFCLISYRLSSQSYHFRHLLVNDTCQTIGMRQRTLLPMI